MQPLLGQRLKAIRVARGLSLAEVSRQTSISRSFLSLVENGQNEITIGRLVRLVGFYGVHISDFFAELEVTQHNVVRHAERRRIPSPEESLAMYLLAPDESRSMLPMSVEFEPGGGFSEPGRHPGEEFIHVVEGAVILRLEGEEQPIVLHPGDTAWYSGEHGHTVTNGVDARTRIIAVISPPNL
jgi:transcriptional regulator with XRE-family HTH domain